MDDVFLSNAPSPESDHSSKPSYNDNTVHLKLLIPSGAAGAIIGKDGRAITSIQQQTSTKVKVSKQNEFFPGTTERVCLVTGSLTGVLQVHQHIAKQIIDKRDLVNGPNNLPQPRQTQYPLSPNGTVAVDRTRQVKVLVPNSTAGMIIGKGGSYIRQLQQASGATIQISQRSAAPLSTTERCVTITGDLESCQRALEAVVVKLLEDPQATSVATFTNISYGGNSPLLANPFSAAPMPSRNLANSGAGASPVMSLMSPASVPNFLLPTLWNANLLPYVLPRPVTGEGRPAGDFSANSSHVPVSSSAYHPHSAAFLQMNANGAAGVATNANANSFSPSGLLAAAAAASSPAATNAAMLQQLWAAAAAVNAAASSGGNATANMSGASVAGSGIPMNHIESACAMKELLVPESFLLALGENVNHLQSECGVSINVHASHSKPIGSQLPMKLTSGQSRHDVASERWRLVTVFGSPSALFRATDRIQGLLQQQQQAQKSSPSTSIPSSSFPMVSGGLSTTKSAASAKPISANLGAM